MEKLLVNTLTIDKKAEEQTDSAWLSFVGLGAVLAVTVFVYNFVVPLTPGRLERASVALFEGWEGWCWLALHLVVPTDGWGVAVLLVELVGVWGVAYGTAVYLSWNRSDLVATWVVLGFSGLFYLLSVLALPNVNTDLFNYMVNGRLAAVYGQNPYFATADAYPDDPIYPFASRNYTANPEDKLPVWTLLNVFLAWLAGDSPLVNLFVYRYALLLFNLANVGLVAAILWRWQPEHLLTGLVFYAWNPVVILFGQGKTDVVMVFFLLLGVWGWRNGRSVLPVFAWLASFLVKLITLPLLAVYLLQELRTERRWYWVGAGVVVVVGALLAYREVTTVRQLVGWYGAILWPAGATALISLRVLAQMGLLLLVGWLGVWGAAGEERLLHGWAWLMVYFVLFLSRFGFSWYLLTLIALVSLVSSDWLKAITWFLVLVSLALNVWGSAFTAVFPAPAISRGLIWLLMTSGGLTAVVLIDHYRNKLLRVRTRL